MKEIYRGDDTESFGQSWLEINADIPSSWVVKRAEFKVGDLPPLVYEPENEESSITFPIYAELTSSQTMMLKDENVCYLALYDENDLKQTCEGSFSFKTKKRVV